MTLEEIAKMLSPRLGPDSFSPVMKAIEAYGKDEYWIGFEAGQQAERDEPVKPSRG